MEFSVSNAKFNLNRVRCCIRSTVSLWKKERVSIPSRYWPLDCDIWPPTPYPAVGRHETRKLWRHIEPYFRGVMSKIYLREISTWVGLVPRRDGIRICCSVGCSGRRLRVKSRFVDLLLLLLWHKVDGSLTSHNHLVVTQGSTHIPYNTSLLTVSLNLRSPPSKECVGTATLLQVLTYCCLSCLL